MPSQVKKLLILVHADWLEDLMNFFVLDDLCGVFVKSNLGRETKEVALIICR